MTDRELLEIAAKAAGLNNPRYHDWSGGAYEARTGVLFDTNDGRQTHNWNPLIDDGDALRLAVMLGLTVEREQFDGEFYACATRPGTHQGYDEPHGSDPNAATRRAIVRAAAEIGRATTPKDRHEQ